MSVSFAEKSQYFWKIPFGSPLTQSKVVELHMCNYLLIRSSLVQIHDYVNFINY